MGSKETARRTENIRLLLVFCYNLPWNTDTRTYITLSLIDHIALPAPQRNFSSKYSVKRPLRISYEWYVYAFYTSHHNTTQQHHFTENRQKEKKNR